jgi:hypothetical protein
LLALSLMRVKEEPETDFQIISHSIRQPPLARSTTQYVRRGIQTTLEELLLKVGWGLFNDIIVCVTLHLHRSVLRHHRTTHPST